MSQHAACDGVREQLLDAVESGSSSSSLKQHLSVCGNCRELLRDLQSTRTDLQRLPLLEMPDPPTAKSLSQVTDTTPITAITGISSTASARSGSLPRWLGVAAVVLILLGTTAGVWLNRISRERQQRAQAQVARNALLLTAGALQAGQSAVLLNVDQALRRANDEQDLGGP